MDHTASGYLWTDGHFFARQYQRTGHGQALGYRGNDDLEFSMVQEPGIRASLLIRK